MLTDIAASPSDPIEGVKRPFGADGRCGGGDIARDAIRDLGESPYNVRPP
jgi:hypothetical protein